MRNYFGLRVRRGLAPPEEQIAFGRPGVLPFVMADPLRPSPVTELRLSP